MREAISKNPSDVRAKAIYEGLLDMLEPTRRAVRVQREMAAAAKAAAVVRRTRAARERRAACDRRAVNLGNPTGVERRKADRRTGRDRRTLS
jgi:hypothetical protein